MHNANGQDAFEDDLRMWEHEFHLLDQPGERTAKPLAQVEFEAIKKLDGTVRGKAYKLKE